MTLLPGDVITTGTPPGVGMGMKPEPKYLKAGDVVTLGITGTRRAEAEGRRVQERALTMTRSTSHGARVHASAFAAAVALVVAAPLVAAARRIAQAYPSKPVKLMVGAPAGGGTDIVARMLGDKLGESMKQPFVVDNRPGASNTIAADVTAKSPPDGYTLLVATNTGQAIAPHLMKLNFDRAEGPARRSALVMVVPNVLIVGPTVTAQGRARAGGADESQAGQLQLRVVGRRAARSTSPARRSRSSPACR